MPVGRGEAVYDGSYTEPMARTSVKKTTHQNQGKPRARRDGPECIPTLCGSEVPQTAGADAPRVVVCGPEPENLLSWSPCGDSAIPYG